MPLEVPEQSGSVEETRGTGPLLNNAHSLCALQPRAGCTVRATLSRVRLRTEGEKQRHTPRPGRTLRRFMSPRVLVVV